MGHDIGGSHDLLHDVVVLHSSQSSATQYSVTISRIKYWDYECPCLFLIMNSDYTQAYSLRYASEQQSFT